MSLAPAPVAVSGPAVAAPRAAVIVTAVGCAALTARPLLLDLAGGHPAPVIAALFVVLLGVSVRWPANGTRPAAGPVLGALPVLALGVGAFAAGRLLLAGSPPPASATAFVVGLNTLAAVAEEAFFRRLVYGALLAGGAGLAVIGSAVLFAAVHVTVYGLWVLPLDLAAGLLFGWQRQATGSWTVPAATHAVANVLVVV
ncbi:MAG TPA: CPBP family intramembrane glutamic endopeptidase [Acidimicrobiales bacterium]|nr:CPBP family intramembrane glutamic endopeptidase [Acidimicrobiales bacterium]